MRKHVTLARDLTRKFGLKPPSGVDENVAIFLYMIDHRASYRDAEKIFQCHGETTWRQFCRVLN